VADRRFVARISQAAFPDRDKQRFFQTISQTDFFKTFFLCYKSENFQGFPHAKTFLSPSLAFTVQPPFRFSFPITVASDFQLSPLGNGERFIQIAENHMRDAIYPRSWKWKDTLLEKHEEFDVRWILSPEDRSPREREVLQQNF